MGKNKHFDDFMASKKLVSIQKEIDTNDYAQSFYELMNEPEEDLTVLGYSTHPSEPSKLFISIQSGEYVLEIANITQSGKTDSDLRKLEMELFEWAYDEGYFDDLEEE